MFDVSELGFGWQGIELAGSLHLPEAPGPFPAVVMLQGSGPADREADGYFAEIRSAFLPRGIATYAFDKPGCGSSTGDWRDYPILDRADQAISAVEAVRRDPRIDAARVGIWGQSQGGWMAQVIAAREPRLAFAIANSGPAIGVEAQDLYGCEHSMRAAGHSGDDIGRALGLMRLLHDAARKGVDYSEVMAEHLGPVADAAWAEYMVLDSPGDWALTCRFIQEAYEPVSCLARVQAPFLAIFGGRDVLVPAWESARTTGDALADSAAPVAMVVVFPEADHRIRVGDGRFAPGYLDLLGSWVQARSAIV